jgi:RimJ/RimL family protein N-acetyltransferase
MPSIPALDQPLTDGRVALRDAAERDIPEILIAHQDDATMYQRLGMERPPSGAELGRRLEQEPGQRATGAGAVLTILADGSEELRGQVIVKEIDWPGSRAEVGVWVAPQWRGGGLASAALRLASRWLFGSCGIARVQLVTDADNEPMVSAARAAGFAEEGTLRGYTLERGGRRDMAILSLLATEA